MPSKKQYDLVSDDGYDSRIPVHNEEAFEHGIMFQAKYIGTLDVPRPSSRVEIVAAMRRIRYEFKAKAIKKKKVNINVSMDGVKVLLRNKKKKADWHWDENRLLVMHHPIYRIFYVSHDSQDLKIWSYIARDGSTNVFKCNVFKAYKKNQAMRIVRTIGQAFEVCHKMTSHPVSPCADSLNHEKSTERSMDELERKAIAKAKELEEQQNTLTRRDKRDSMQVLTDAEKNAKPVPPSELSLKTSQHLPLMSSKPVPGETISSPLSPPALLGDAPASAAPSTQLPLSSHHQVQLLRQQLEQQQQQTQIAIAQVHLLKDQLAAETAARIEAQARAHQLLMHNRDLLEHVQQLIGRVHDLEVKVLGRVESSTADLIYQPLSQIPILPDATTPHSGPVYLPEFHDVDMSRMNALIDHGMFENTKTDLDTDSPDSGHKEMSSDSLSANFPNSDMISISWYGLTSGTNTFTTVSGNVPIMNGQVKTPMSYSYYHPPTGSGGNPNNNPFSTYNTPTGVMSGGGERGNMNSNRASYCSNNSASYSDKINNMSSQQSAPINYSEKSSFNTTNGSVSSSTNYDSAPPASNSHLLERTPYTGSGNSTASRLPAGSGTSANNVDRITNFSTNSPRSSAYGYAGSYSSPSAGSYTNSDTNTYSYATANTRYNEIYPPTSSAHSADRNSYNSSTGSLKRHNYPGSRQNPAAVVGNSPAYSRTVSLNSNASYSNSNRTEMRGDNRTKIITPLPPQDASGNRLELGSRINPAPRIEPPPKFKRSVSRQSNSSITNPTSYNMHELQEFRSTGGSSPIRVSKNSATSPQRESGESTGERGSDSDYYSTYPGSNASTLTMRTLESGATCQLNGTGPEYTYAPSQSTEVKYQQPHATEVKYQQPHGTEVTYQQPNAIVSGYKYSSTASHTKQQQQLFTTNDTDGTTGYNSTASNLRKDIVVNNLNFSPGKKQNTDVPSSVSSGIDESRLEITSPSDEENGEEECAAPLPYMPPRMNMISFAEFEQ